MATSKSTRSAINPTIEDYSFDVVDGVGLMNVPSQRMTVISSSAVPGSASGSFFVDLPFKFPYDGKVSTRVGIGLNGWIILKKEGDETSSTDASAEGSFIKNGNARRIVAGGWSTGQTGDLAVGLLCPWISSTRAINTVEELTSGSFSQTSSFSATDFTLVSYGAQQHTPFGIVGSGASTYGVRYHSHVDDIEGRCFIVRWNVGHPQDVAYFKLDNAQGFAIFDCVLYENGKIEFRYEPYRSTVPLESADILNSAIGCFASGNISGSDSLRFRDFTSAIGYDLIDRVEHPLGGFAYNSSYFEAAGTTSYAGTDLIPVRDWPAKRTPKTYVFRPIRQKHKNLPRVQVRDSGYPTHRTYVKQFNDNRTVTFNTTSVGSIYPFHVHHSLGNFSRDGDTRSSLFYQHRASITASTRTHVVDQFIDAQIKVRSAPFDDSRTSVTFTSSSFYTTGTSVSDCGLSLAQPLSAKSRIDLTFNVDHKTKMLELSSSILYFNHAKRQWNVPVNTYDVGVETGFNDIPDYSGSFNVNLGRRHLHTRTFKGFTPTGLLVTSHSAGIDVDINKYITTFNSRFYVSSAFINDDKGFLRSQDYDPAAEETYVYDGDDFVIEKIITEIPIETGPGWYNDTTKILIPITDYLPVGGSLTAAGGPVVTFGIVRTKTELSASSLVRTRDLIVSSTFTSDYDNRSYIIHTANEPVTSAIHLRVDGSRHTCTHGGIVSSSNGGYFTGSIRLEGQAAKTSGFMANFYSIQQSGHGIGPQLDIITADRVSIGSGSFYIFGNGSFVGNGYPTLDIASTVYGRSNSGFVPSGRSVFGREHFDAGFHKRGTVTKLTDAWIENPLYATGSQLTTLSSSIIALGSSSVRHTTFLVNYANTVASPYLIRKNDKLSFFLSKCWPCPFRIDGAAIHSSGSIEHDIKLSTGSFKISLFGSTLRQGDEITNRSTSTAMYDNITSLNVNDVVDQFDVEDLSSYAYSYTDDVVTGSMVTIVNNQLSSSNRHGRAWNKVFAATTNDLQAESSTTADAAISNPSLSERLIQHWEKSGNPRILKLQSNERFYDSLTPKIDDFMSKHGSVINLMTSGSLSILNTEIFDVGLILTNVRSSEVGSDPEMTGSIDNNLSMVFPFEARYSTVQRMVDPLKNLTSKYYVKGLTLQQSTGSIKNVNGLMFWLGYNNFKKNLNTAVKLTLVNDRRLDRTSVDGGILTGSLNKVDVAKVAWGIGRDRIRTQEEFTQGTTYFYGANNYPDFRKQHLISTLAQSVSPVIRGWKYGLINGTPRYSGMVVSRYHHGHVRDVFEQRHFTKFFIQNENGTTLTEPVVNCKFVDSSNNNTDPLLTWSQNVDTYATSSLPYFDDVARNRGEINTSTVNSSVTTINFDQFSNVVL